MKICGIYKIVSPSGKIYIGQSIDVENRKNGYSKLRCKSQIILYRSFIKYGFDSHDFSIIEICTIDNLNERERFWQEFYDVIGENGMNLILTKTENAPQKWSEESRRKASMSAKGKKLSQETRRRISESNLKTRRATGYVRPPRTEESKKRYSEAAKRNKIAKLNLKKGWHSGYPIIQLENNGSVIKEWDNATRASNELGIERGSISLCIKGKRNHAGGFIWCAKYINHINNKGVYIYKKNNESLIVNNNFYPHADAFSSLKKLRVKTQYKKVLLVDKSGLTIKEYDTISDAATDLGISNSGVSRCCSGKYKQCKGNYFKYKH